MVVVARLAGHVQVEGFPPPTELKTVYVEHDIDGSVADLTPEEFIFTDPTFKGIPKEEVRTRKQRPPPPPFRPPSAPPAATPPAASVLRLPTGFLCREPSPKP